MMNWISLIPNAVLCIQFESKYCNITHIYAILYVHGCDIQYNRPRLANIHDLIFNAYVLNIWHLTKTVNIYKCRTNWFNGRNISAIEFIILPPWIVQHSQASSHSCYTYTAIWWLNLSSYSMGVFNGHWTCYVLQTLGWSACRVPWVCQERLNTVRCLFCSFMAMVSCCMCQFFCTMIIDLSVPSPLGNRAEWGPVQWGEEPLVCGL